MEMAYRDRWRPEIADGFDLEEGKNVRARSDRAAGEAV
jgi:hypothetical protein